MPAPFSFDYAIVRVVPRTEREEFINVGVVLYAQMAKFLQARMALDEARLRALWPAVALDEVRNHLAAFCATAAGTANSPISQLPLGERFRWLASRRSTIIQLSAVHSGVCQDPAACVEALVRQMVRVPEI